MPYQVARAANGEAVQQYMLERIAEVVVLTSQRHVTIGLSGGSMIKHVNAVLHRLLTEQCIQLTDGQSIEWSRVQLFMCDERHVPLDSVDSNGGAYRRAWKTMNGVNDIVTSDPTLSIEQSAANFAERLSQLEDVQLTAEGLPRFDLLLLGLGPDGHTCSLFPDVVETVPANSNGWTAYTSESPKPPPCRVTLTYPVLNNARCVVFVVGGSGKQAVVDHCLSGTPCDLPAARVKLVDGVLIWLIDTTTVSVPDSVALNDA